GGDIIHPGGSPLFLPAFLMEFIPRLTSIRVFARFSFVGYMLLCILAFYGMESLFRERKISPHMTHVIYAGVILIFLLESGWSPPVMVPFQVRQEDLNKIDGPVLALPYLPTHWSGRHLYLQTIHHQPVYVAEFSRLGRFKQRYLNQHPALV